MRATDMDASKIEDAKVSSDPNSYACTQVIGFSQTREWYYFSGTFEPAVGDDRYQLLWNPGGGVDKWSDPNYKGWSNELISPCTKSSATPDRVILTISGPAGSNVDEWTVLIEATLDNIRTKIPSAKKILLQAVVGGPNEQVCSFDGRNVRASVQHPYIDQAIARVIAADAKGDLGAGMSPEVRTCADYEMDVGHLVDSAEPAIGQIIGNYYK